jgi:hypothetical protein
MRYKKCNDRKKRIYYIIYLYQAYFLKCNYINNINILNIILYIDI